MTGQDAAWWRRVADRRLEQLNDISKIGAEPPAAVLAIITGAGHYPDAGTSDTSTAWHSSVTEFRRALSQDAAAWQETLKKHFTAMNGQPVQKVPPDLRDAYMASLTAASFAYALAAVLGVAEREFGPQTARRLASIADDLLENGDDNDLNGDVAPGAPLPPPTPGEQAAAGQISIDDEEPAS